MSVNIEFSGGFKITSDSYNWIINRKKTVDPTKSPNWQKRKAEGASPEKHEKWTEVSYHGNLDHALDKIVDARMKESEATSLSELREELTEFRREISGVLQAE
ncbi:hypothetical protein [Thalassobacillus sp. CUG 92003]|uniref:hypothetical protein n=1 Tax=Thalassobacillus sp. CUG 92003 TaxID=2736641 RepID=UPI0015E67F5B|nr:hypothetical protein [Thalassobacillus sp. CUG 92003]